MRKRLALLFLGVMVAGLGLTALGTQQTPSLTVTVSSGSVSSTGRLVSGQLSYSHTTSSDYTLNYIGGVVAIVGAVAFGIAYPIKRPDSLRIYPTLAS